MEATRKETGLEKAKRESTLREEARKAKTKNTENAVALKLKLIENATRKKKQSIRNVRKSTKNAIQNAEEGSRVLSGQIKIKGDMSNNELQKQINALESPEELAKDIAKKEDVIKHIKDRFKDTFVDGVYSKACKSNLKDFIKGINVMIGSYLSLCLKLKDNYGYENPYDKPHRIINKEEIDEIKTILQFSNEKISDDEIRDIFCNNIKLIQKIVDMLIEKLSKITDTRTNNNNRLYNVDINNYIDSIHKILHYLKNEYENIPLQLNYLIKNLKEWINKCNDEVDTRYLNNNQSRNNNKNKLRDTKILEFSEYTKNYISIMNEIVKLEISKELIPPEKYITSMKNDLDKQIMSYRKTKGIKNNNKNASNPYNPYNMCIFVSWLLDQIVFLKKFIIQNILFDSRRDFIYLYNIKLLFEYINDNLSKYQTDKNYERFNSKMKNTRKLQKQYN